MICCASASSKLKNYARVDHDREKRRGFPEVIYCQGKTPTQASGIAREIYERSGRVLASRADVKMARAIRKVIHEARYHEEARMVVAERRPLPKRGGVVGVVAAGTSDFPVAEEAGITAETMGNRVRRYYDVGVAGVHRLLSIRDELATCSVLIVVAGMEGALPSVVGGLLDKPVIAVPTSVGYGANLGGIAALLAMLNSCSSGITVVNIDNGFGAAYAATLINRQISR